MAKSTVSNQSTTDPTRIEVEQCFACGNEPFQRDVLAVWAGISKRFPVLATIAQAVFSVYASSTSSKTQFSKARKVANPFRNSVDHKSMQETLCLKSWYLVPKLLGFEPVGQ